MRWAADPHDTLRVCLVMGCTSSQALKLQWWGDSGNISFSPSLPQKIKKYTPKTYQNIELPSNTLCENHQLNVMTSDSLRCENQSNVQPLLMRAWFCSHVPFPKQKQMRKLTVSQAMSTTAVHLEIVSTSGLISEVPRAGSGTFFYFKLNLGWLVCTDDVQKCVSWYMIYDIYI